MSSWGHDWRLAPSHTQGFPSAADDALRLANENNAGRAAPVALGTLSAVLGLLITCIVLQTFVLLAFAQKRFGFLSDSRECQWRPRVCKAMVTVFIIAAVGAFGASGYKDALRSGFEHDVNAVVWYGDGYGCAVAAIVFSLLETALVFVFAADLEHVAQYFLDLGAGDSSSGGMMAAAAQLSSSDLAARDDPHTAGLEAAASGSSGSAGAGSKSSYSKLTADERAAILRGDGGGAGGGYQGSSAYANL